MFGLVSFGGIIGLFRYGGSYLGRADFLLQRVKGVRSKQRLPLLLGDDEKLDEPFFLS